MNDERGAIYIATGEKYVDLAAKSAQSLKACCPGLSTHIFTECSTSSYDCFDGLTKITDPHRRSKVDYIFQTPYQRTLYLDADTRVCEDITHIFELLDKFDIVMTHSPLRTDAKSMKHVGAKSIPKSFPDLNDGLILFRRTGPVIEFLKSWQKAYYAEGLEWDQFTLRGIAWSSDLKLGILPPEYNVRKKYYLELFEKSGISPKILHFKEYQRELGIKNQKFVMPLRKKLRRMVISGLYLTVLR